MAGDQVEIILPKTMFDERSSFTIKVKVRTRDTGADATPTTLEYRVDNLTVHQNMVDWTTVSAASDAEITLPASAHELQQRGGGDWIGGSLWERFQVCVSIDRGLTTEHNKCREYRVYSRFGV